MGNTIASLIRWHFSAAVHSYTVRWRRLWAFWWISSQGPTTIFLTEDRSLNTQCICQSADGATWYTVQGPSYKYWNLVKKERMYEAEQDSAFKFFSGTKECFGDFQADESQQLKVLLFPPHNQQSMTVLHAIPRVPPLSYFHLRLINFLSCETFSKKWVVFRGLIP